MHQAGSVVGMFRLALRRGDGGAAAVFNADWRLWSGHVTVRR